MGTWGKVLVTSDLQMYRLCQHSMQPWSKDWSKFTCKMSADHCKRLCENIGGSDRSQYLFMFHTFYLGSLQVLLRLYMLSNTCLLLYMFCSFCAGCLGKCMRFLREYSRPPGLQNSIPTIYGRKRKDVRKGSANIGSDPQENIGECEEKNGSWRGMSGFVWPEDWN